MSQKNSGFSLIELTVVVIIGGLLMAAFADMLLNAQKQAKIKITKERLEAVDDALRNYSLTNYRLPCVARRNAPADTANFAVELADCNLPPVAGESFRSPPFTGAATHNIRIGTVPTRTLNLPDSFGYDAWGGRFLYAVNEVDTNVATYGNFPNQSIHIIDRNNNSVITPDGSIRYLVLSHGGDREGAFNSSGVEIAACQPAELDGENCNNNPFFRTTTVVSDASTAQNFDDLMSYKGNVRVSEIPSGAIMAFRATACPNGWNVAADLRGRVIVGLGTYNQAAPPSSVGLSSTYTGQTYSLNARGGSATIRGTNGETGEFMSLPPYVALIYCEKI